MNRATHTKVVGLVFPQAIVDNDDPVGTRGDANPVSVDTAGYTHCTIYIMLGATDIAMASGPDVYSHTAAFTTDVGTLVTGAALTEPAADDDNKIFAIDIPLGGDVGRYLAVDYTCGDGTAGTYSAAWAVLSGNSAQYDQGATARGLEALAQAIN